MKSNSTYEKVYQSRAAPKGEVLRFIRDGDSVMCNAAASTLLTLLDDNYQLFHHVSLYTIFSLTKKYRFLTRETNGHIKHFATFVSPPVREAMKAGEKPEIVLTHFSDMDAFVRSRVKPNVLLVQVTPMDENGYFTMGPNSMGNQEAMKFADRVIVHVNRMLPVVFGECNKLHINQVTALFEEDVPIRLPVVSPLTETDIVAAEFIAERIPNGATIQLGVGKTPDAVGSLLEGHKHLGVHSELFTPSLARLMEVGAIDNSQKTFMPEVAIFGFVGGNRATQECYDYVNGNPKVMMAPISWVNDPMNISKNENFVSVNSTLAVDLRGQVSSETIGQQLFSGPGGQVDFVRGAKLAKYGQSFIVLNSTAKKNGMEISKIDVDLVQGSVVTTSRHDVDKIVTEYGVAELRYKSISERAKALIAIAHPQFRDELVHKARKAGLLI